MNDDPVVAFTDTGTAMAVPANGDVVGVVAASGEIKAWAPSGRDPLDSTPEEMAGRRLWELFAGPVPEALTRCWLERRAWRGEAALRHHDGSPAEVLLRLRPLLGRMDDILWTLEIEPCPGPAGEGPGRCETALLKQWALEQLPLPMALFDRNGIRVAANAGMTGVLNKFAPDLLGLSIGGQAEQTPQEPTGMSAAAQHVLSTGETVTFEAHSPTSGETGACAWLISLYAVRDPAGRIEGVSLGAVDTTEQYLARRRLGALNRASERIGTTLDLGRTADELAEVATECFADLALVDLLDRVLGGEEARSARGQEPLLFRRVAQRSVLPGCPESVVALGALHSYARQSPHGRALAIGRPLLVPTTAASLEEWGAGRPERAESIQRHGIHSSLLVPLCARGLILGVAVLSRHRTPDPFSDEDLRLAEELASRAAVCVDNARRYTRERSTALTLQRTLLPEHAPREAGPAVEVASRYLPADPEIGTGGDWYDVIPLSGARVALVVGDVVGHGIQASATMGRLCTAVRTLADVDLPPDELLTQLDDLVLRLDQEAAERRPGTAPPSVGVGEVGATCLYVLYDPVSRRCVMARAGHPVPALIRPDGSAEFVDVPAGPPLGLGGLPFEVAERKLPEGSVLALYTDGLLEGSEHEADIGVFRAAITPSGGSLEASCDELLRSLPADHRTDDAALLLVRTKALGGDRVADWQPGDEPTAVGQARKWVARTLTTWNLPELEFLTELVVSELVTNAIRYGRQPVRVRLILPEPAERPDSAATSAIICEVSDASSTAPHLRRARTYDEGGRGLFIVAQLTRRWGSRQTSTGKTIWAEIPLAEAPS
ncbi:SpoIIE family protein phosphatase [Streptomyces arenae]|uniref:SpoIIE family protein phosphatase n=1 Tax=Streptomyces arenae TaxID=29301 RepID=UPI0026598B9A|nr:SpoIIE family protein phosphatase [Streptomyces arenae]MCG7207395.1 SpoIIE family protein phosphatase [Streptomyces arenae]